MSEELQYPALIFALFVVPRILQRWRVPTGLTALAFGLAAGVGFALFQHDHTIELLSTLGIVALFLFAGMDVDLHELRSRRKVLIAHVAIGSALLVFVGWLLHVAYPGIGLRAISILALALVTPSTGFILDSLGASPLSTEDRVWVKSKAIANELLALAILFAAMQSTSAEKLGVSTLVLGGMIMLLPSIFRLFAQKIAPYAPDSEFAFLMIVAMCFAMVTRRLGAYYLVGAFIVGIATHRFQKMIPALSADGPLISATKLFAGFFIPFYFFDAGLALSREDFSPRALLTGLAFFILVTPTRVLTTLAHRKLFLKQSLRASLPVAISLLPTLVFGLVLASVLRDHFQLPREIFGGLIINTLLITALPSMARNRLLTPAIAQPPPPPIEA